ncbi:hypothetical protein Ct61P_03171 [Colletotrichum tofieldiae]|nr:hypothetical protein Ct61P_03171 [Colletotrichum tofieldiae]
MGCQNQNAVDERQRRLQEAKYTAAHEVEGVEPDGEECNAEEVVRKLGRLVQKTAHEGHGLRGMAALEILEATHLQGTQLAVVGGEQGVQRHGQDVDDGGQALAAPVEFGEHVLDGHGDRVFVVAAYRCRHLGLEDGNVLLPLAGLAEVHDKAAMVERPTLLLLRARGRRTGVGRGVDHTAVLVKGGVGDVDSFAVKADFVAVTGHSVDALEGVGQSQLAQGDNAAGLQKLADDAIRLLHPSLEQDDASSLLSQGVGNGAAKDAGANDNDVGLVVLAAALGASVSGCCRTINHFELVWRGRLVGTGLLLKRGVAGRLGLSSDEAVGLCRGSFSAWLLHNVAVGALEVAVGNALGFVGERRERARGGAK